MDRCYYEKFINNKCINSTNQLEGLLACETCTAVKLQELNLEANKKIAQNIIKKYNKEVINLIKEL